MDYLKKAIQDVRSDFTKKVGKLNKPETEAGKKIIRQLSRLETDVDARRIAAYSKYLADKLRRVKDLEEHGAAFRKMQEAPDDTRYKVNGSFAHHSYLRVGLVYKMMGRALVGRKHIGVWLQELTTHNKAHWLPWYRCADLVQVGNDAQPDADRVAESKRFENVVSKVFGGV